MIDAFLKINVITYEFFLSSGIMCFEKLEDMLKLVSTQVVKKDGKYVVQKYIGTQYLTLHLFID